MLINFISSAIKIVRIRMMLYICIHLLVPNLFAKSIPTRKYRCMKTSLHAQDSFNFFDEPLATWPADADCIDFVGNWKYWYRRHGMQTSTDDVLVAYVALYSVQEASSLKDKQVPIASATVQHVKVYVELGCGIGSILLLVAQQLQNSTLLALGVEAQPQSAFLAQQSIRGIIHNKDSHDMREKICAINMDIREFLNPKGSDSTFAQMYKIDQSLVGCCELVTANPPYACTTLGTMNSDPQRRAARFELRGGIEDYAKVAAKLLTRDGRFVFAFWSKDKQRVHDAAREANLVINARLDVLMGNQQVTEPYLCVFDASLASIGKNFSDIYLVVELDIRKDPTNNKLSPVYKKIQQILRMHSRPLK